MVNSTSSLVVDRVPIFSAAIVVVFGIIFLNTVVLFVSYKIPALARNPLCIFYTFLGVSDLLNGVWLLITSFSFYFEDADLFHNYYICLFKTVSGNAQLVTTGYLLLLLTFVKCFSIISPLKSLQYVSREMAICSSAGVWVFSYTIILVPSIIWRRDGTYYPEEECDIIMAYNDNLGKWFILGLFLSGTFYVVLLILNSLIVVKIFKRNSKVGLEKVQVLDNGPSVSDSDGAEDDGEISTSPKQVVYSLKLESKDIEGPRSGQKVPKRRASKRKQKSNSYDFRKTKSFKAYLTVLMHVGFKFLCGLPAAICVTNKQLKLIYISDRRVRFGCYMFLCITSLINPILTLLRLPVFNTTLKKLCKKIFPRK